MSRFDYQPESEHEEDYRAEEQENLQETSSSAEQRLGLPDQEAQISTERLRYVEELLRSAPLLSVPMGFADRVVAALRGKDTDDPDYKDGLGLVLGLFVSLLTTLAMLGLPIYFLLRVVITGEADQTVDDISGYFEPLFGWIADAPAVIIPAAVVSLLFSLLLTGYVIWFVRSLLSSKSEES